MEPWPKIVQLSGYAYAVSWVAGIQEGDTILEPSAGSGSIATMAKNLGGDVTVNELEKDRQDILNRQFKTVWIEDANHLPAIKAGETFDRIIMNPPFSNEGSKGIRKRSTVTDSHVLAAMRMLNLGGRLVVISGPSLNVTKDGPVGRAMNATGTIVASVDMDGNKLYRKYGTTFDNKVTVWDKVKSREPSGTTTIVMGREEIGQALATGQLPVSKIVQGRFDNLSDFMDAMEQVVERAPRPQHPVKDEGNPNGNQQQDGSVAPDEGGTTVLGETGQQGETDQQANEQRDTSDSSVGVRKRDGDASQSGTGRGERERVTSGSVAGITERPLPSSDGGDDLGGRGESQGSPDGRSDGERTSQRVVEQQSREGVTIEEDAKFASYQPSMTIKGAVPHPGNLVETSTMATVAYPTTINYIPHFPEEVITEGGISSAQLERVILAGEAHSQMIDNGSKRKGFLDGDGTGSGKGRSIVAVIYDNYMQGRKKAVWFSASKTLSHSAKEDAEGVGWKDMKIIPALDKASFGKLKENSEGVIFSTYSQIATPLKQSDIPALESAGEKIEEWDFPRVKMIADWLGEDFDGVIVFDEAHKMKNVLEVKIAGRVLPPSKAALAGVHLFVIMVNTAGNPVLRVLTLNTRMSNI